MVIPQLSIKDLTEFVEKTGSEAGISELHKLFETIREEQGKEFDTLLTLTGLINPNLLRGFLLAYFVIRKTLNDKEVSELEKMVK